MEEVVTAVKRVADIMGEISARRLSKLPASKRSTMPLHKWT